MTIGDRIKQKRLESDKTLDYIAKIVKVGRATIHKYENNIITTIPSDKIELLAQALHTTPAYLMGWEEEEKNSPSADELSPKKQALMQFVQAVPEDKAEMILQVMKTILQVD